LENVQTAPGQWETRTFTVNVRNATLKSGGTVRLKTEEQQGHLNWDDKLTLEFNGSCPAVCALKIEKVNDVVTLYLAGDSTVTDQKNEPYGAWGQLLPRFCKPAVAVANHAQSGESLVSFRVEKRLKKILETIKAGDYLFIQFGHNDQKDKSPGAGPFTSYKENLKYFVTQARQKGAIPVLVSPMERRRFDGNTPLLTLADYAEAVRQVGREESVPVIDLHAMSLKLYAALGPAESKKHLCITRRTHFRDKYNHLKTTRTSTLTVPISWPGVLSKASKRMCRRSQYIWWNRHLLIRASRMLPMVGIYRPVHFIVLRCPQVVKETYEEVHTLHFSRCDIIFTRLVHAHRRQCSRGSA
jgi:lysophospholipase L1-like esterase